MTVDEIKSKYCADSLNSSPFPPYKPSQLVSREEKFKNAASFKREDLVAGIKNLMPELNQTLLKMQRFTPNHPNAKDLGRGLKGLYRAYESMKAMLK